MGEPAAFRLLGPYALDLTVPVSGYSTPHLSSPYGFGLVSMPVLRIHYDEELLVATGQTRAEFELELRFLLGVKLYELGRVSAGQAAKLTGMPRLRFLSELARRGFTVVHLDPDQVAEELRDEPPSLDQ
jgi:predicted HTH domain antitoxin